KQSTASLVLVLEGSEAVKSMLRGQDPTMMVAGRRRSCRVFRENVVTPVCERCQQLGHPTGGCKSAPVCRFCRGEHETSSHKCTTEGCDAALGNSCQHMDIVCVACERPGHVSLAPFCPARRGASRSTPVIGSRSPIVADPTAISGISGNSVNRNRKQRK